MKITVKDAPWSEVRNIPVPERKKPVRPGWLFRALMRVLGSVDLHDTGFTFTQKNMERLGEGPYLILMNHSAFIDLEIVSRVMFPKPYCIVCTSDGFVGKEWLMRSLGCIPTRKFVTDPGLISDMRYALRELSTSVLMYPEASYSFDGTATALPRRLGILLKRLGAPVVMIRTHGAFLRDPLYNGLKKRKVRVSAEMQGLLSAEEIKEKSVDELDAILDEAFTFDHFKEQREEKIPVTESFRTEGLERILYKCPVCGAEGKTRGTGVEFRCEACSAAWHMDEYGQLVGSGGFSHIPDWYAWEREEVRSELETGTYRLDCPASIMVMADYKSVYRVGEGRLVHTKEGFSLTGCGGELTFTREARDCYGLYADYYWYERGDIICIGDKERLYYCFPPEEVPVAKARLAAEEAYKLADRRKA